jgi:hypothetical protein
MYLYNDNDSMNTSSVYQRHILQLSGSSAILKNFSHDFSHASSTYFANLQQKHQNEISNLPLVRQNQTV